MYPATSQRSRIVIDPSFFLVTDGCNDQVLLGGLRRASAFRGAVLARCTRGEVRNHCAGE